jgi:hypothetical protein
VKNLRFAAGAISIVLLLFAFGMVRLGALQQTAAPGPPVLVELFTSEGCSSCPPADDLLAQIERKIPNAVVLSEHVTYWNNGGWHDPFSLDESTARQADYVERLKLEASYTPQMIVGGRYGFVGSNAQAASQALARDAAQPRVPVNIENLTTGSDGRVSFSVRTGAVPSSAQLLVVMAQNEGSKHVSNGENGGRTLTHVQIARSFLVAAKIKNGASYSGNLSVALPQPIAGSGFHLVAFLEQGRGGPILGVASQGVQAGSSSLPVKNGE